MGEANEVLREKWARSALAELTSGGLLLQADGARPSVVRVVVGGPVSGSWWSHPRAHDIYAVCQFLEHHADATTAKLVLGKVTYVRRALWPALVSLCDSRASWQMDGLSRAAQSLLREVTESGDLRTDQCARAKVGGVAAELERRLLVHAEGLHTERGAHAKRLESWPAWSTRVGVPDARPSTARAREALETHARRFGESRRPRVLPWLA
jgi:hypothetical protein